MRTIIGAFVAAALALPAAARVPARLDVPLKSANGGPALRLSQFQGKPVLVDFWATHCIPCREAKPFFEELQKKFGERGFVVLAVDVGETAGVVRDYLKAHPTTLKVALDPDFVLEHELLLSGEPAMALFDADGGLLWSAVGFTPSTKDELRWRIDRMMPGDPGRVPLGILQ